jgi:hypothetical protein
VFGAHVLGERVNRERAAHNRIGASGAQPCDFIAPLLLHCRQLIDDFPQPADRQFVAVQAGDRIALRVLIDLGQIA